MVLIDNKKYACETCIKGHRSSSCNHTSRPLVPVKSKGRPVTQCEHCRELRKTKQVHVKCECNTKDRESPFVLGPGASVGSQTPDTSAMKEEIHEETKREMSSAMVQSSEVKGTVSDAGLPASTVPVKAAFALERPPPGMPPLTRAASDSGAHAPGCACSCSSGAVCSCFDMTKVVRDANRRRASHSASTASDLQFPHPLLHQRPRRTSPPLAPPPHPHPLKLRTLAPKLGTLPTALDSPDTYALPSPGSAAHGHIHHRMFSPYGRALEQHELEHPPAHPYGIREGPVSFDESQWFEYQAQQRRTSTQSGPGSLDTFAEAFAPSMNTSAAVRTFESDGQATASSSGPPPSTRSWLDAMQPYDYDGHSASASGDVSPNPNTYLEGSYVAPPFRLCTCGPTCACPGCSEHNARSGSSSPFHANPYETCADPAACGGCIDCRITTTLGREFSGNIGRADSVGVEMNDSSSFVNANTTTAVGSEQQAMPEPALDQMMDADTMLQIDEWLRSVGTSAAMDFGTAPAAGQQPPQSLSSFPDFDFGDLALGGGFTCNLDALDTAAEPGIGGGGGAMSVDFEGTPVPPLAYLSNPPRPASDPGMSSDARRDLGADDLFSSALEQAQQGMQHPGAEMLDAAWLAALEYTSSVVPDAGADVVDFAAPAGPEVAVNTPSSYPPSPPQQSQPVYHHRLAQNANPTDSRYLLPPSLTLAFPSASTSACASASMSAGITPPGSTIASSSASASVSTSESPASLSRASSSASASSRASGRGRR